MTGRTGGGVDDDHDPSGARAADATFIRLVYCFCQGISIAVAARNTGLSHKTVRKHYLALRALLLRPAFNRWHGTSIRLLKLQEPEWELMVRLTFFGRLAECAQDAHCARNYRLGNRKARQCRACPLKGRFSPERIAEAYLMIDTVHAFYETLGIRGEKDMNPVLLFRERLVHTTVVGTVQNNSRKLANGFFDPTDTGFLSGGRLMDALLSDLAREADLRYYR